MTAKNTSPPPPTPTAIASFLCIGMPVAKSEVSEALTVSGCSKILVETPEVAGRPTAWHF